jgi:hypothetical protein
MRLVVPFVCAALLAGCATHQIGPTRPITIDDDVAWMRSLSQPQPDDLLAFRNASLGQQAQIRNQVVTARMYIADMEYHTYEARLTKDIQEEGLAATLASLGLTTSATLLSPAATKTILSGIATAVTGADKAFNEKFLLSNTIQALQTQMRADRKEQAATIYAKMFNGQGGITLITEYTLPMALSDVDAYYQAGTISSALIGLSKTLSAKETHSDEAKAASGPNPAAVSSVKVIASPPTVTTTTFARPRVIRDASAPLPRFIPPAPTLGDTRIGPFEQRMSQKDMNVALGILGCTGPDLGLAGSPARRTLTKFLAANDKPPSDRITNAVFFDLRDLKADGKQGTCGG